MKWINYTPARTAGQHAQGISSLFLLGTNLPAHTFASLDTAQSVTSPPNHPRPSITTTKMYTQQRSWYKSRAKISAAWIMQGTKWKPLLTRIWELQQLTFLSWGEKQKEWANKIVEKESPWLESAHTFNKAYLSQDKGRLCAGNDSLFMGKDWQFWSFSALPLAVSVIKKSISLKLLIKHLDFC